MTKYYKENNTCLVCGSLSLVPYLDLTDQPLANSYHKGEVLQKFPLSMNYCSDCWHSQLSVSADPSIMFEHYLYISDTSKTLTDYFNWTTDYILSKIKMPNNALEIACNSGLLLEMFQNKGIKCVGVDPAKNIRELSRNRNLEVYVDYWDENFSKKLVQETGKFDLILAFHVLPHVQDPNNFIRSCLNVLSESGSVFIQTSQCDMFINNEFDVIYHEHSSYFTGKSIRELAHRNGLYVSSIVKTDIHSKSFLFSLQKEKCEETELKNLIQEETNNGIYTKEKYIEFANKASSIKEKLLENLYKLKQEGYTLIGYGAAAKGNTLLNYLNFKLDYIIDDNYMKWGYLTPGMNIEIHSIDLLKKNNFDKICFIPLAWNFYSEIKQNITKVRNIENDIFIRYFPDYSLETLPRNLV